MEKNNDNYKRLVYVAAFLGQNIALFISMRVFGGSPILFLIPPFLMAILFYFVYHKINKPTMWSYMGIQCVSAISYYMLETILTNLKNKGKPLPPNCIGPILDILGIAMIEFMALLAILLPCIVYKNLHNHL